MRTDIPSHTGRGPIPWVPAAVSTPSPSRGMSR
jgi:hypothetical protein